jgi:two-component system nitrogen regulation response regulator GlnG
MKSVLLAIEELSQGTQPVLIEGEPGTGRELIARLLHLRSARADRQLVSMKREPAPGEVVAFPVATQWDSLHAARGGTLLVRDICHLPKTSQRKLNRILAGNADEQGTGADIRLVATCEPGLVEAVQAGMFYEPLYRKVATRTIVVPPLRERREDLIPLMSKLVSALGKDMGRNRLSVSSRASDALLRYPWPGNVAELKQVARRLVVRAKGERIEAGDVDAILPSLTQRAPLEELSFEDLVRLKLAELFRRVEGYPLTALHEEVLGLVERPLLQLVLEHTGNNQLRAAEILGVSRNTLRRRLLDFGLLAERASTMRARRSTRASAANDPAPAKKSRGAS